MKNQRIIKQIILLLSEAPNEKMRFELLELFFTANELEQLVARYNIVKGLTLAKSTQRELASLLNLSIAKITRGSNELKRRSALLKDYLFHHFSHQEK